MACDDALIVLVNYYNSVELDKIDSEKECRPVYKNRLMTSTQVDPITHNFNYELNKYISNVTGLPRIDRFRYPDLTQYHALNSWLEEHTMAKIEKDMKAKQKLHTSSSPFIVDEPLYFTFDSWGTKYKSLRNFINERNIRFGNR